VTRKTKSAKEERRAEAYEAVLAGLQQALTNGTSFNSLSVAELAALGGISRSRFYAHFRDKGEFLCTWLDEVSEELAAGGAAWWTLGPDPKFSEVRAALAQLVESYGAHTGMMSALTDAAVYDADVSGQLAQFVEQNISALARHIEQGQREGWIDTDLLARPTAEWLICMTERTLGQAVSRATADETDREIDAFTYIVWHALYAEAADKTG
jgi:AcrR family transcriptional regulator